MTAADGARLGALLRNAILLGLLSRSDVSPGTPALKRPPRPPGTLAVEMVQTAVLLLLLVGRSAWCGPIDSHPTGGPWSQAAEFAKHEVALAVLVRDLELSEEQARKIHDGLKRLERTITGLAKGSGAPALQFRKAMAGYRDRMLATRGQLPDLTRDELKARQTWEENVWQLDREQAPIRAEIASLLTPAQRKVLCAFSVERTLVRLGFEEYDLTEWAERLIALRAVPDAELESSIKNQLADHLQESGHPERLPAVIAAIRETRALPPDRFDATLTAHARKVKGLLAVAPEAKSWPPENTALNDAVDNHLLDMRMIPVLDTYFARAAARR